MNAMNQQQKKDLALEQWAEKYDIELESVLPYYSLYVMAHAFKNTEYGRRMARQRFKLTDEPADNRKLVTLLKDLESYRVQCDKSKPRVRNHELSIVVKSPTGYAVEFDLPLDKTIWADTSIEEECRKLDDSFEYCTFVDSNGNKLDTDAKFFASLIPGEYFLKYLKKFRK